MSFYKNCRFRLQSYEENGKKHKTFHEKMHNSLVIQKKCVILQPKSDKVRQLDKENNIIIID